MRVTASMKMVKCCSVTVYCGMLKKRWTKAHGPEIALTVQVAFVVDLILSSMELERSKGWSAAWYINGQNNKKIETKGIPRI